MGTFGVWQWVVVLIIVLILFGGGGKLSRLMGDMARGITSFKKGLKEETPPENSGDAKMVDATVKTEVADAAKKDEPAKS